MKKRILSFVLALLMMVSTVPAPVFAADGGEAAPVAETEAAPTTETTAPTEPEETTAPTEPAETTAPTEPAETTAPTEPAETTAPAEPAETTAPTEPAETTAPTEPAETTAPTEPPVEKPDIPAMFAMFAGRSTAEPQAEGDSECNCPSNHDPAEGHVATCPLYTCPRCGAREWHQTCPYEAHVGKYVKLNEEEEGCFVDDGSFSADNIDFPYFAYEDFEENTIFHIVAWHWWSDENTIWYRVEIYSGGVVEESAAYWPEDAWIMQCYTNDENLGNALTFVDCCSHCGKPGCTTEHVQCDKCGEYDCTRLHFWCDHCNQYDCGKSHLICRACGEVDCTEKHVFCGYCNSYDSCLGHDFSPVTTPVIPANPEMTPGADVSIVDENGSAITGTNGLVIHEGTKTSISAWTDLTGNIDYQWQICYDDENDLWTNIQGQTGKGLLISPAMVNSVIELTGSAMIRCRITSGATVQYSADIPVEVVQNASAFMNRYGLARTARNTALYADVPELKEYTVVINYVYEDNAPAADSYTATLAAGSGFSATVTFPSIMGYLPYFNEEIATSLPLNIENIQADVTYTVTYMPTNVNYTVFHYHQNLNDDGYTIAATETKQGLTNSQVPEEAVAKNYPGFVSLLYERPTIAADGSTEVEIYYDREYYLMIFNLDGGYGVEPIYDRYGATVSAGIPTKAGYTFDGWNPEFTYTTMPAQNTSFTAVWKVNDLAKVSIEIWGENADNEGYSYIKTGEFYAKPGETINFAAGNIACGYEVHTHTSACFNCGNEEHTHSVDCCTVIEHTHSAACCTTAAHTHNAACCTVVGHTHNTSCYENVGSAYSDWWGISGTEIEGSIGVGRYGRKYIYINGAWYNYSGRLNAGSIATATCGETIHDHTSGCIYCAEAEHTHGDGNCIYCAEIEHTHGDGNCVYCNTAEHSHDEDCFTCTKTEHSHSNSCYMTDPGMNSTLWVLKSSDKVTVAADGSTVMKVYYDRTTFTLTFREYGNTVATITDKWGALISDEFEKAPFNTTYNGRAWKCTDTSKYGYALQTLDRMPQFNATFNIYNKSSNILKTIYYYLENVGAKVSHTSWPTSTNKFTLLKTVDTYFNYATYEEEYHEIEGFTRYSLTDSGFGSDKIMYFSNDNKMYLYYLRNSYRLDFHDGYNVTETATVEYQAPLSNYDSYVPDPPEAYEEGSVAFGGWYLSPDCSGDEFNLMEQTMPLGNLILYAKWIPVYHTVKIYLTEEDSVAGTNQLGATQTVEHRKTAIAPDKDLIKHPDSDDYKFVVWLYKDKNGEVKEFDFTMPVTQDLVLYPKWNAKVLKEYVVYFKLQGDNTQIADPIISSTLAGETKTFDAKGGTDLYTDYQEGYFPLVKSHSMVLEINTPDAPGTDAGGREWVEITDKDGNKKIVQSFTFWYEQKDAVPYTVYYVAETLKAGEEATDYQIITRNGKIYYIIADTYINSGNRQAVVTEKFEPVSGYMPDAYQKRLVVDGTNGAVNEIIFYYSVDSVHAYYKITHYTQNTDGEHWTEYASSEVQGTIGQTYSASPLTIPGFTYGPMVEGTVTEGVLTADGLELKLYYVRNSYPYEVRYLERGTGIQLWDPKHGTGLYGAVVSESAIPIENYIAADPTSQTLTIRIEESRTEAKLNIITFYYEQKVTINYVAVGYGSVTPESETLKVLSGVAQGSTATAAANHRFVGWYSDEACTVRISEDANYVPTKAGNAVWTNATYYAKFEPNAADLTIRKEGWLAIDENQTFIFDVTGPNDFKITVTINGNGSVTIKDLVPGEYTVTERTDWSWRYTPDRNGEPITLVAGANNEVIFKNTRGIPYWLSGDNFIENQFTVKPKTQE